jgi:hypothetical protein
LRFTIISGTEIFEIAEHHDEAGTALDSVRALIAERRPNIRIVDHDGRHLRRAELELFAAAEGEGDEF